MSETVEDSVHKWPILRPIETLFENDCVEWFYVFGETGGEVMCGTTEGIVFAFGQNLDGVLGLGHNSVVSEPTIVPKLRRMEIDVIVSNSYTNGNCFVLALNKSGKIYSWGSNKYGCLGNGSVNSSYESELMTALEEIRVIDICCGLNHCLALSESGEVYAWGCNQLGECGNGVNISPVMTPIKVPNLDNIKITAIACGGYHSLALTETGVVYGWGFNQFGELGIGNLTNQSSPIQIKLNDVSVTKIRAGLHHTLLLSTNGDVYGFGDNSDGQVDNMNDVLYFGQYLHYSRPKSILCPSKMSDIEAVPQRNISMAVSVFKKCFVWGVNGIHLPFKVSMKSLNETHS